ncbi:MAG: acetyl-CoA carboxylase biotin carboxyl carrier protein subunit [Clostridia bacterium]|nr:acetyl-CoA carboxylase biotin carboxyl carrier protein subunit [Clostridia bacterium]
MKYIVTLNGKNYEVEVEETEAVIVGVTDAAPVAAPVAAPTPAATPAPVAAAPAAAAADGTKVLSPMPGNILSVSATVGATVKAGDVLLVLEAMKMENDIVAPCDGTVKQILVQKGSTVATDDLLAVVG